MFPCSVLSIFVGKALNMEDMLEGIVLPQWGLGSVMLLIVLVVSLVFVVLVPVESGRWLSSRLKGGLTREDMWKAAIFCLLVVMTAYRGYVYYHPLFRWVWCLLGVCDTPSWETLQDAMLIQESVWAEVLRCASHALVYAVVWVLIRRDRRG